MGKYSKSKLKKKHLIPILIIILVIILALAISYVLIINVKNTINVSKVDDSAKNVSEDVAKNSTPLIINNLVVGAVYNNTWVSSEKYYLKSTNKQDISIDIYQEDGKAGKYTLKDITKQNGTTAVFVTTDRPNQSDEYFAIATSENELVYSKATELSITDEYIKEAKKALSKYRLLNYTISVNEAFGVTIDTNTKGVILCVTSQKANFLGVYSAIIYVDDMNKSKILKYSYIKDTKNASSWPIYTLKFTADLNGDSKNEVIIQETSEFSAKYSVLEYRDNNFYEVLSNEFKL